MHAHHVLQILVPKRDAFESSGVLAVEVEVLACAASGHDLVQSFQLLLDLPVTLPFLLLR